MTPQPTVLADVPRCASFLFIATRPMQSPRDALDALAGPPLPEGVLVGLGPSLLTSMERTIPGVRPMPPLVGSGVSIPSTGTDLLLRITGDDPGEVLHRERAVLARISTADVVDRVDAFRYAEGRDLSGYEDGTENPTGDAAHAAAFMSSRRPGLTGSTVVAVQRWEHHLDVLDRMTPAERDAGIGRDRETNEELAGAPASAHVKRTAQEDFEPPAFLVRRSMPWRDHRGMGLVFVSFSASLDPFEALLRRMVGLDDGIVDRLFGFTRPVSGGVWWCPPVRDGRLDLRALR
ncbi:MAG: putative iron-dependent peroxidase [Myxococcota bacterium]|jgi:putative iron-dependent peroxidase